MLKITKRVEYALIAIRHLQENQDVLVSVSDISAAYGIPKEILAKTLQKLASSNIVKSYKGPTGGYKATKKIAKTTLNDFFEILEEDDDVQNIYSNAEFTK